MNAHTLLGSQGHPSITGFFKLSAEIVMHRLVNDEASLCYPSSKIGKGRRYFMLVLSRRWLELVKEQKRGQHCPGLGITSKA